MIRFLLALIFVTLFLIITLPIQLVVWLLGKKWPKIPDKVSYPLVGWCFNVILWIAGTKKTVIGKEKVPTDQAVLYIGNHRSFMDILATYPEVVGPTGYLSKDTFKKVPSLNSWMYIMHCIFLDRSDIKQGLKCILDCIELIKNGYSVTIFPEGTRNRENDTLMEFHEGSFKVALKTGCPIIPMCINYDGEVFEEHLPRIKPMRIIVEYGDPIYPDKLAPEDKKHIGAYTRDIMIEMYKKNKESFGAK